MSISSENRPSRILVAGASGRLGKSVITELKSRGEWVRALTRYPDQRIIVADEVIQGDLKDHPALHRACRGIDIVFSVAGASLDLSVKPGSAGYFEVDYRGNLNLLKAAEAEGVQRFVYVSVSSPAEALHTAYVQAHVQFEDALRESSLHDVIVRPTGFFSAFDVVLAMARLGVLPLMGDGSARTNPIHTVDLARICAGAIQSGGSILEVGGPDVLTRREILELTFEAVGRRPRFIGMPGSLIALNRMLIKPFDRRLSDLLEFFQIVNTVDTVAPATGRLRLQDYLHERVLQNA